MWGAAWQRGGVQCAHLAAISRVRVQLSGGYGEVLQSSIEICLGHGALTHPLPAPCQLTTDAMLALVSASAARAAPRRSTAPHRAPLRAAPPRPAAVSRSGAVALLQLRAGVASRAPSRAAALGRVRCVAVASTEQEEQEAACQQQSAREPRLYALLAAALNTFLAVAFLPLVCTVKPITLVRAEAARGAAASHGTCQRGLVAFGGPRSCAPLACTRALTAPAAPLLSLRRRPCALRPFAPRALWVLGGPARRPA